MKVVKASEVDIAEYVNIVDKDGQVGVKELLCVADASARVEQMLRLVGNTHVKTKVMCLEIVNDLTGKVVHIDHRTTASRLLQPLRHMGEQRFTAHRNKCLGHGVGERLEPGAEPGCKYHCLHSIVVCVCHIQLQSYDNNLK